MKPVYLDNAATSFPKAPGVAESMSDYILNVGCNVNRGVYSGAHEAQRIVFETRELLCELFNFDKTENVVFTKNITESLNVLIKGLLKPGDHVIVSSMEHNAVMRPLTSLSKKGVEFSRVPCNIEGGLADAVLIEKFILPNTKAVIMTHASNVCGTIMPLAEVRKICKKNNLFFIIDAAQTAGFLDIDFKGLNADAIAFTGHKSLLGPQGMGGFVLNDTLATVVSPLIEGGTGSISDSEEQPNYLPDKYESGTMNLPGVFGLNASLKYLKEIGLEEIRETELSLAKRFLEKVTQMKNVRIAGINGTEGRTATISLDFQDFDNSEIAFNLSNDYGIMTRCGLHCAPSAHKTLGTFPQGTVRFSFSHSTTPEEIDYAIDSINGCIKG
ncbi:MAG: aminotransferase class V-fold PLP-dependent enzyme [Clostridiaceae bacterium]